MFKSYLVANPEDRFSRDMAQIRTALIQHDNVLALIM